MKRLIVYGAGDLGKFIVYNIDMFGEEYDIIGFMDDDTHKIGQTLCGLPVFGIDYLNSSKTDGLNVVIAISSPRAKECISQRLATFRLEFPNFISPKSWISKGTKMGKGILLYPNSSIDYEAEIGDFTTINAGCTVGHNVTIGRFATLAPGVNLSGFTRVEEKANLGIGCCSIQRIRIGSHSVIGGQAMLIEDVESDRTVVGVPAKIIK